MHKTNSVLILTEAKKNRGLCNTSHTFMVWYRAWEKNGYVCTLWHKEIKISSSVLAVEALEDTFWKRF